MPCGHEKDRTRRGLYHIATEQSEVISHFAVGKIYRVCFANISLKQSRELCTTKFSALFSLFRSENHLVNEQIHEYAEGNCGKGVEYRMLLYEGGGEDDVNAKEGHKRSRPF